MSPPLKWAGGKRWQLPHLRKFWDRENHRRLVEPFCGGLAVALGLQPAEALLNDANPHLINFYEWLQRGLRISIEMANDAEIFYEHRDRFNQLLRTGKGGTREAASLFYYLNRTGYNGLCRFNRSGEFNVPFGRYANINYRRSFVDYRPLFKTWEFSRATFDQIRLRPDDFVYADPPYDVEFTTYSAGGFTWEDQVRTAELLPEHGGPILLSNQATKRIVKLYRQLGFALKFFHATRRISSDGNRETAREVLAMRNVG